MNFLIKESAKKPILMSVLMFGLTLFGMGAVSLSQAQTFSLTSTSIQSGQTLSYSNPSDQKFFLNIKSFGCEGGNVSPALSWSNAPQNTQSFVITFRDEDAPTGSGFWHGLIYNIPASVVQLNESSLGEIFSKANATTGLIENSANTNVNNIAYASINSSGGRSFLGMCPPSGRTHNYVYKIYALKNNLTDNAAKGFLGGSGALTSFVNLFANKDNILASAELRFKASR